MTDWVANGRKNRGRGKAFERKVAKLLGEPFIRVPYSGAHKAWGKGDVMDALGSRGYFSIECKTQPAGPRMSISIKDKWIDQAESAVVDTDRAAVIATQLKGQTEAWVFLSSAAWDLFAAGVDFGDNEIQTVFTKRRGKGRGFVVQQSQITNKPIHFVYVEIDEEVTELWPALRLTDFVELVKILDLRYPKPK